MKHEEWPRLPIEAVEFLKENAVSEKFIGEPDDFPLYEYTLHNGDTVEEYVQYMIPGSGAIYFLGLKCGRIVFEWPEQ